MITPSKSWAEFINEIGLTGTIALALLAILGYVAFKGVPAIVELTVAIQRNTDTVTQINKAQEYNQSVIVSNQTKIIDAEQEMIAQHSQLVNAILPRETALNLEEQTCLNTAKSSYQQQQCMNIRNGGTP